MEGEIKKYLEDLVKRVEKIGADSVRKKSKNQEYILENLKNVKLMIKDFENLYDDVKLQDEKYDESHKEIMEYYKTKNKDVYNKLLEYGS